ncbi:hypothetical protein [Streptomyces sp. NPDC001970]
MLLLDGRWTLADWGTVRRPSGQTTKVGRTRLSIGTPEFAAPELSEARTVPRSPATSTASAEYRLGLDRGDAEGQCAAASSAGALAQHRQGHHGYRSGAPPSDTW